MATEIGEDRHSVTADYAPEVGAAEPGGHGDDLIELDLEPEPPARAAAPAPAASAEDGLELLDEVPAAEAPVDEQPLAY